MANGGTLEERVAYLENQSAQLIENLARNSTNMKALLEAAAAFLAERDPGSDDLQDKINAYVDNVCRVPPGCL